MLEETLAEARAETGFIADERSELCRPLEGTARELAAWIDEGAPLALSVAADGVEVFEGEADKIHRAVTSAAGRLTQVYFEAISQRRSGRVRLWD